MKNNGAVAATEYKLEWIDHLHELYGSFTRRNDLNEWIYFFRRPEFADPEESGKIAAEILRYIVTYGNISQKVVKYIEIVFHYADNRKKYEEMLGYGTMEYYCRYFLGSEEFPPYRLFEDCDPEKDYDGFLYTFHEIYYQIGSDELERYKEAVEKLGTYDIRHPYTALLYSEYYDVCGQWQAAIDSFDSMEAGYYKYMHMGFMLFAREIYDVAENCFAKALTYADGNIDVNLINQYVICKWECGKQKEAMETADEFAERGYEFVILPLKQQLLYDLSSMLSEKAKERELTEAEMLIMKEFCMSVGDYESVIKLGEMGWAQNFENSSWIVDMAEAYFETGQFEQAKSIVDMVYTGKRAVTRQEQITMRVLKARLLFGSGKIKEAYEMMEALNDKNQLTMRQQLVLADMYMTTGKITAAIGLLSRLRFNCPENFVYAYMLAECFMKSDSSKNAHYLFSMIFSENPKFAKAAYFLVQSSIDSGELEAAEKELEEASEHMPKQYVNYLHGQILEMKEKYDKAKDLYYSMILDYDIEPFDEKLLHDVYSRYFCMREEVNGRVKPMLSELERAVKKVPKAADLWVYYGDLYERAGLKEGDAEECYRNAIKADPFNEAAMQCLMSIYADVDRWSDVWELSNALVLYTDSPDAYMMRIQSSLELGKIEQCLHDLEIYEQNGGDKHLCCYFRGQLAMVNGEYEKAAEQFEIAAKNRKASDKDCYDDLAVCMCKLGNTDEAIALLDMVCRNSRNHVHHFLLLDIYTVLGDFKAAKKTLQRYKSVCKVRGLDDTYTFLYAELLMNFGKNFTALRLAESVASLDGERLCGIMELLQGHYGKAIRIFSKLVAKQNGFIDNYSWLSLALYLKGKMPECRECAKDGLKVFFQSYGNIDDIIRPDQLCQYGFLQTMYGDMEKAKKAFDQAVSVPSCSDRICKDCYEAHCGLGIYHACSGNMSEARREFNESLNIRPANAMCRGMSGIMTGR